MRLRLLFALMMLSFTAQLADAAATNLISIHLLKEGSGTDISAISAVIADDKPVLADADFLSFNVETQVFSITADAAKRLSREICARRGYTPTILREGYSELIAFPTYFLFRAQGEPIYIGAFGTDTSSQSISLPAVLPESMPFIKASDTKPVIFEIEIIPIIINR